MTIEVRSNEPKVEAKASADAEVKPQAQSGADQPAAGAKASVEIESTDSGSEENEEVEGSASESEESESGDGTDPQDQANKEPNKKKGGFQRRIDKLNARVTAREQELEYWKQQALKGAGGSKAEPKVEPAIPVAGEGKPQADNFDTHAEYVEALTDWKVDQKANELSRKQAQSQLQTEQAKQVQSYGEKRKEFSSKTPDFDDVMADVDDIRLSPAVAEIILSSDNGPELAYELAKNREAYERICKLPPNAAAREMGRLEERLSSKASSDPKPEPKKITKAPQPLNPVTSGGKGSAPKSVTDPTISQAEYERARMVEIKKRRQA